MSLRELQRLAELNGVQTFYLDAANKQRTASPEALSNLLKALGVPAGNGKEIKESLRASRLRPFRRGIEPVIVCREKEETKFVLHLPAKLAQKRLRTLIRFEGGREEVLIPKMRTPGMREVENERFATKEILLPRLPPGYHKLEVSAGDTGYRAQILSAPVRSYPASEKKSWGAFLPMYAAHSKESWGAGNFSDWERLSRWLGSEGAGVAAALPLLSAFLDYPVCEPSPYSPASRLFWNEFYIDVTRVPEFALCREARAMVASRSFQKDLRNFRRSEMIDYSAQWKARRKVFELLAKYFFSEDSARRAEFNLFVHGRPEVNDYAAFRAACDTLKTSWHNWPQRMRAGRLRAGDYDEFTRKFHLYIQWLAHSQIDELVRDGEKHGVRLYLDLPLGVNPDGYDVWRERDSFALEASAGAPPDLFFSRGQDWGFAPLHPQRIRESGYRHVLAYLRFQMSRTRMLRIDHVMGLHRLYWVPRGFGPAQGTYVNYAAEEWHAIFNLESHRHQTLLVGENLGTVPPAVNESMERHGLRKMYVLPFEERPNPKAALAPPPALSVASLNTHDMPTFVAHWRGDDLAERIKLGLLSPGDLKRERQHREKLKIAVIRFLKAEGFLKSQKPSVREVLRAVLAWLRASRAETLLVNLEDLWLEERPQNVPGTTTERPNWRRKARLTLEQIMAGKRLRKLLPPR